MENLPVQVAEVSFRRARAHLANISDRVVGSFATAAAALHLSPPSRPAVSLGFAVPSVLFCRIMYQYEL